MAHNERAYRLRNGHSTNIPKSLCRFVNIRRSRRLEKFITEWLWKDGVTLLELPWKCPFAIAYSVNSLEGYGVKIEAQA